MNLNDKQKFKIAQSVAVIAFALATLAAAVHFTDSCEAETQSELVEVETETGKKMLTEAMLAVTNEMAEKYAGIDMEAETEENNSEGAERGGLVVTTKTADSNPDWVQHTLDNLPEYETYTYIEYEGDYSDLNLSDNFINSIGDGYVFSCDVNIYYSLGLTTDQFETSGKTLYYKYGGYNEGVYVIDGEDVACVYNDEVIYVFPLTDEYTGFYDWGD